MELQADLRQGVDDDAESLTAELQLMEEFFFQGLPFPQGRRVFCPIPNCSTHLLLSFACAESLCCHLSTCHNLTLKDLEARYGWSSLIMSQNLPVQSAQLFSEPNAALARNVKNKAAFMNVPSKVAVAFVSERKHHSLETLMSQLTSEKTTIQSRIHSNSAAILERDTRKSREIAARRSVIGDLLPKLDSAITRLKTETGSKLTQAILDIGNLAFHGPHVRSEIMSSNVLPAINTLLQSRSEAHREHAASAIKNLCLDLEHQRAVRKAGCIPHLVALLRGTRMQRKESLCALVNLVRGDPGSSGNVRNQREIVATGGLEDIRQINETANDSVRQLTESVLAWMDTYNPEAVDDGSSSECGGCEPRYDLEIQTDEASICSLDRCIEETKDAFSKLNEFRYALPSIQVVHVVQPQAQPQHTAASFPPRPTASYSHVSSHSDVGRSPGHLEYSRRIGVRSASITNKYFTHIGNMDYTCNTCGSTVRDGTRDYHMKRYHPDMVQRLLDDARNNPEGDGEKKISVLSVVYENLGDLNFRCKLCDKIVRDGSRDYHIKQHHGDRMEELKEQKRKLIAERRAPDVARRYPDVVSLSTPAAPLQESDARVAATGAGASFTSASHAVKFAGPKPSPSTSHKKAERPLEPREPKTAQCDAQQMKKKGVSLRENDKLRSSLIECISSFMERDICLRFRNDEGATAGMRAMFRV